MITATELKLHANRAHVEKHLENILEPALVRTAQMGGHTIWSFNKDVNNPIAIQILQEKGYRVAFVQEVSAVLITW